LTNPADIPLTSQKIQTFFSKPSNKSLLGTTDAKKLAQLQNRFLNYQRLAQELGSWSCNIDRTTMSVQGKEILQNTLSAPVCSEISPEYLQDFKKVSTLLEEIRMIEDQSYSGE